jgi:hypothetical protein
MSLRTVQSLPANYFFFYPHKMQEPMSDDPDRNMKNEKFRSQLNTYFKRHMGFRKADESLGLRAG